MWADNETERDFLNFSGVAETVAEIIVQAKGRPISIGVSGAWGIGKSSMIKLTRSAVADVKSPAEIDVMQRRRKRQPFAHEVAGPRILRLQVATGGRCLLPVLQERGLSFRVRRHILDELGIGFGVADALEQKELGEDRLVHAHTLRLGDGHADR
ncbi:P-loop NTPase fold protein [Bradyrhizobium diazoefficiens]|uniref:P-loop NTPase fold protein n=1 Tax=Bradyrhizobium diazoefficiens TaxID=1355477 RepID=UPI0034E5FA1A